MNCDTSNLEPADAPRFVGISTAASMAGSIPGSTNARSAAGAAAAAVAIVALCLPQIAISLSPEAEAESAARAWLAMVDAGNYAQSWHAASTRFRESITQSEWVSRVSAVRDPLGAVRSRKLSSAQVAHSLPGAPAGEYVVLQFSTSYEHKGAAMETVTPMKDSDGKWHVSGYYIK